MIPSLEEYVKYGVQALQERKKALMDAFNKATNPLDRLSLGDRINEIDYCVKYFEEYQAISNAHNTPVSEEKAAE